MDIRVSADPAADCAELLLAAATAGEHIVVTGGSTPRAAYERAAAAGADWSHATIWWSDERCVPPDDELSNYRLVDEALLRPLGSQRPAVHRMRGESGPAAGADDYERALTRTLGEQLPHLDLMLLGLGPDAHVASLFPSQPTLDAADRAAVGVERAGFEPYVPRISLTLPVLCNARHIVFLITGSDKADAVARAFGGDPDREAPGSLVRPTQGRMTVLLDAQAARRLQP